MIKYILILALIPALLSSQDNQEYYFITNLRNAKTVNVHDYYFKGGINYKKDNLVFNSFLNYERDEGEFYQSFKFEIEGKRLKVDYFTDTEKDINYIAGTYKIISRKYLRLGYDISITEYLQHAIYTGVNYVINKKGNVKGLINLECVFLDEVRRFNLSLSPIYKINEKTSIAFDTNILYVDNKTKWNSGIKIKYMI